MEQSFFAEDLGIDEFRALIQQSVVPLEIDPIGDDAFRASLSTTVVDEVSMLEMTTTPHTVRRTERLIEHRSGDHYKLSLQLEGVGRFEQDGRAALVEEGDLTVYDTTRPYRLEYTADSRFLVIVFPRRFVDLPPDEVARVTAVPIAHDTPLGAVVHPFFQRLGESLGDLRGPHGRRLVHTALDLIVTLLSQELASRVGDDPRRALTHAIRATIDERLADPTLTPTSIAAAHYISTRHLHALFAEDGTTVAGWIRERRLEHIRRDLADPVYAGDSVGKIAARWGLSDASHFSKLFKARFGIAPSAYRSR